MRWMEPGTFLMGSQEGKFDESKGELPQHPQHPVTLSQGFWLADTPCTQALWQALMGENPSAFKSAEDADKHPVGNVSFDDVQAFSVKLGEALPTGWLAGLPTEAQWEYACRAGTTTAYWWGDEPDDTQANWNQQQKGTTPVTKYAANPWGLYDMHGNVWEWCADAPRKYSGRAERDPVSDREGTPRVVRGGSRGEDPKYARATFRRTRHQGTRSVIQGFRFALRSSSPGAEPTGTA
jgi:formylglycine-generating enzyme required for sulfatase activity